MGCFCCWSAEGMTQFAVSEAEQTLRGLFCPSAIHYGYVFPLKWGLYFRYLCEIFQILGCLCMPPLASSSARLFLGFVLSRRSLNSRIFSSFRWAVSFSSAPIRCLPPGPFSRLNPHEYLFVGVLSPTGAAAVKSAGYTCLCVADPHRRLDPAALRHFVLEGRIPSALELRLHSVYRGEALGAPRKSLVGPAPVSSVFAWFSCDLWRPQLVGVHRPQL